MKDEEIRRVRAFPSFELYYSCQSMDGFPAVSAAVVETGARSFDKIGDMDLSTQSQDLGVPMEPTAFQPAAGDHIGVRAGYCGGKPHILGHRIKVEDVAIWYERAGMSPSAIVEQHPTITLGQVHAALSYYYDHRPEIEADIREGEAFAEALRAG